MQVTHTVSRTATLILALGIVLSGCVGANEPVGDETPGTTELAGDETPGTEPPETTPDQSQTETTTAGSPQNCTAEKEPTTGPDTTQTETTAADRQLDTPDVAIAPATTRVKNGESDQLDYRGRNITVRYYKSGEQSHVEIGLEDGWTNITRSATDPAETVSWSQDALRFVVKPVTPEKRDGQTVYLFAENWSASYVELDVYLTGDC